MKHLLTATFFMAMTLVISVGAQAEEPSEPKSSSARGAIAQYERDVRAAEQAYLRAVQRAQARLKQELEAAKLAAMKAGNLDEANAIQAKLDEIAEEALATSRDTVKAEANASWQKIADLKKGVQVIITAAGGWTNGLDSKTPIGPMGNPDHLEHGLPNLALIGRIGPEGKPFLIGEKLEFAPEQDGELQVIMNRAYWHKTESRMIGTMRLKITIKPELPAPADIVENDELRDNE